MGQETTKARDLSSGLPSFLLTLKVRGFNGWPSNATRRYGSRVLTFLAAFIPSIGSLIVACWALIEWTNDKRERTIRERLRNDRDRKIREIRAEGRDPGGRRESEVEAAHDRMLAFHGLDVGGGYDDMDMMAVTGRVPARSSDLTRQWILLITAVAGLVLLAVSEVIDDSLSCS